MTILQNQRGAVLITALVILVLLTIIGMAATNTSMLETMIAATEKNRAEAFHAAEAGIDHQRGVFKRFFVDSEDNQDKMDLGIAPDWDFALQGTGDIDPATGISYTTGARWIVAGDLGGNYLYNVTVWDNDDGGVGDEHLDDTDGIIYLRSDAYAKGPGGGNASIEIMLKGTLVDGSVISGYGAQEGGGAAKSYSNGESQSIEFTKQIQ